jgi:2-keto-4-pentenoate hydratase/2-oxohepta-3-ene-1,7-dioic acid hydratase in catechol pathway
MWSQASDGASLVVGVAYTYDTSRTARRELTRDQPKHSSWTDSFSFFVKCRLDEASPHRGELRLNPRLATNGKPLHWPEAELAALLGPAHEIVAYTLANDFTAFTLETGAGAGDTDNTYLGKCWPGSCGLGPAFVPVTALGPVDDLPVTLRIERGERTIYADTYRTSSRNREFSEVADLIVRRRGRFGDTPPRSKCVHLDESGRLPAGTVILLGTGLIVPPEAYCRAGDRITVSCPGLGELSNVVARVTSGAIRR